MSKLALANSCSLALTVIKTSRIVIAKRRQLQPSARKIGSDSAVAAPVEFRQFRVEWNISNESASSFPRLAGRIQAWQCALYISSSQFELVNFQLQQNLVEVLVDTLMTVEFVSLLASSALSLLHYVETAIKDHQYLPPHKEHLYLQLIWLWWSLIHRHHSEADWDPV